MESNSATRSDRKLPFENSVSLVTRESSTISADFSGFAR
jgi:hypothetical protein